MMYARILAVTAAATLALLRCATGPTAGGTDTGNGVVLAGTFYYEDGTRAKNATVQIRPRKDLPQVAGTFPKASASILTVLTDMDGRFGIEEMDTGTYVIEVQDAKGRRALLSPVRVLGPDSTVEVADTLRAAGAVKGVIRLSEGGDVRKVFVLISDLERLVTPDTGGRFVIGDVPEGIYTVRLLPALEDYEVMDTTGVLVKQADTIDLDTIEPRFAGVPGVRDIHLLYDTLRQTVTLTWKKGDTSVAGYNLYRRDLDTTMLYRIISNRLREDTAYSDTVGVYSGNYEYRITSIDIEGRESRPGAALRVRTTGFFTIVDSIVMGNALLPGNFGVLARVACDGRSNIYITDTKNGWLQKFDSLGNLVYRDTLFDKPMGISISTDEHLLVADFGRRKVRKFNLDGVLLGELSTGGSPLGALLTAGRQCIISDSGIEIYNLGGAFLSKIPMAPKSYVSADIDTSESGVIYFCFEDKLCRLDAAANVFFPLYTIPDIYNNQDARIVLDGDETVLLLTHGPTSSQIRAVSSKGEPLAKWQSPSIITDLCLRTDRKLVTVSDNGRIMLLRLNYTY